MKDLQNERRTKKKTYKKKDLQTDRLTDLDLQTDRLRLNGLLTSFIEDLPQT